MLGTKRCVQPSNFFLCASFLLRQLPIRASQKKIDKAERKQAKKTKKKEKKAEKKEKDLKQKEKAIDRFDKAEQQCNRLIEQGLPLPAYDFVLDASHTFNLLDARHAISVSERQRYILRVRALARAVAQAYFEGREALGFPMLNNEKIEKAS